MLPHEYHFLEMIGKEMENLPQNWHWNGLNCCTEMTLESSHERLEFPCTGDVILNFLKILRKGKLFLMFWLIYSDHPPVSPLI